MSDCVMTIDNRNTDYEDGDISETITLRATDDGGLISDDVSAEISVVNLNDNAPTLLNGGAIAFSLAQSTVCRGCLFVEETTDVAYA